MKRNFTLLACFLCMLFTAAKAAETEPNDTRAQANVLALNGSNFGKISPAGDHDWWKITTTGDGQLSITLSPLSGRYTYAFLYDNDGVTQLASSYSNGVFSISADGLAAGTYYVQVFCYYNTDTTGYTISNTLTQPAQANDAEPNNTKAAALTLPLNGSKTGHIGYLFNNKRDTTDWYKITTNADGLLTVSLNPVNGQYVYATLYDNDGKTALASQYSNSAFSISADGLAAGTYYVQLYCYYSYGFAPYTLSNSLTKVKQANDAEPDSTRAQALTLPLNDSVTGHIGYYYKSHRDTVDWYKVTTNAEGVLRFTLNPVNGQPTYITLYDNDGTTVLNSQYSNIPFSISNDGLAAGTYYVKVNTYYSNSFTPYILYDSLFAATPVNDVEPNDAKAQALVLPQNGSKNGHVGYYYNHRRDSSDWYKLTTTNDGLLRLSLSPTNGQYTYITLYDKDGATVLNSQYSNSAFSMSNDGLAAGTYYVKVNTYYPDGFTTYTLSDSLFTYTDTADIESNSKPYLAKTLPANNATAGHVGFYYNNQRDTLDWWKINYTGSGALTVTLNFEPNKLAGYQYTYLEVYKDTAVAPIFSQYTLGASLAANFTSLTQGYYYVKVFLYYNNQFEAYTLTPTFTQVNKAKIKLVSSISVPDCSSTNSLTLKCSGSKPPYKVQLLRFDTAYGSPRTVVNTKSFTFSNLPYGVYSAKVYGDGATGSAFTKLIPVTLAAVPTNLTTTNITSSQAKLNWTAQSCVSYYTVQYRKLGDVNWTTASTIGAVSSYLAQSLSPNTSYEWHVAPVDSANKVSGTGSYSVLDTFKTSTSTLVAQATDELSSRMINTGNDKLSVYPNPAASQFTIELNGNKFSGIGTLWLRDINGTIIWSKQQVWLSDVKGTQVNVNNLASGTYLLQVVNSKNEIIATQRVVIAR